MTIPSEKLRVAVSTGNELKRDVGLGKEWYGVYAGYDQGIILDFIYQKANTAYPNITKVSSTVGTFWQLWAICKGIFRHDPNTQMFYIHKRRFKRHLKKALCRSRCIQ